MARLVNDPHPSAALWRQTHNGHEITMIDWVEKFQPIINSRDMTVFFNPVDPVDAAFLADVGEHWIWTDIDTKTKGVDRYLVMAPGRLKCRFATW
jgi:hypothetical protein